MNAQILFIVCFAGVGIALTTCAGLMLFLSATPNDLLPAQTPRGGAQDQY